MSEVRITVEYFAQARTAAGAAEESLTVPSPATLSSLIRELARRHGPSIGNLLLTPAGGLSSGVIFAIGGRQAPPGEDVTLRDGDTVVIVPPISGGGR